MRVVTLSGTTDRCGLASLESVLDQEYLAPPTGQRNGMAIRKTQPLLNLSGFRQGKRAFIVNARFFVAAYWGAGVKFIDWSTQTRQRIWGATDF